MMKKQAVAFGIEKEKNKDREEESGGSASAQTTAKVILKAFPNIPYNRDDLDEIINKIGSVANFKLS